ncbi:Cysteine Protease [Parasponia andersonii]|uniref:Cysteine Protease n=1 Tax=Parasponia andersonii TaxID=3476 RepID=A0A2P5C5Q7_PARAD|nr:Cysteine Protease [Parasponia andersonii]
MSFAIILFLILGTWASQGMSRKLHEAALVDMHEQWMAQYERTYADNNEKEMRFEIFKNNLNYVENFNKEGNRTYKLGINTLADLTNEEFLIYFTGFKRPIRSSLSREHNSFMYENLTATDIPTSVDWRNQGAVTDIKDQQRCGCCWSFSAVAAVEGITQIKTGNLVSLSEQQLVDCTKGNEGCNGGIMEKAFEFIMQNKGIATEASYPYQERDDLACQTAGNNAVDSTTQITGYEQVPASNEEALLKAVSVQPVSVGIEASESFKMYQTGVFSGDDCGRTLNHAVTIVGYGTTDDGTKYWLVKNSWGKSWGENGYMKILRDVESTEGVCGIATQASYPTA